MVDASRRQAAQSAHAPKTRGYGHFGIATYDSEASQWSFTRNPSSNTEGPQSNHLGTSQIVLVRPLVEVFPANTISQVSKGLPDQVSTSAILKSLPELAPSLCGNTNLSAPQRHEAFGFPMLAFGNALILGSKDLQSGFQTLPIVAHVCSGQPDTLFLMILDAETIHSEVLGNAPVRIPSISVDVSVPWTSTAGVIQQLQFSSLSSPQEATWLAVRQTTATTIFQPLFHRTVATFFRKSALDINPVLEIPISRSGGLHHADVVFDPENSHQLAIVDTGGNWGIWVVTGARSRSTRILYHAQLTVSGSFATRTELLQQHDGWHKLAWLKSSNQRTKCLLVANRESIAIFDLKGALLSELDLRVGVRKEVWLLDLRSAPLSDKVFILTTNHVYVISDADSTYNKLNTQNANKPSVQACWDHSYARDDTTITLNIVGFTCGACLILVSARSNVMTAYDYNEVSTDNGYQLSVTDPTISNLSLFHQDQIQFLGIHPIETNRGSFRDQSNSVLLKAYFQRTDGAVYEALLQLSSTQDTRIHYDRIPLPKKQYLQRKSAYRVSQTAYDEELEDFIVPDHDVDLASLDKAEVNNVSTPSPPSHENLDINPPASTQSRSCDMQRTYHSILAQCLPPNHAERQRGSSIMDILQDPLHDISIVKPLLDLILESSTHPINVDDIENDSQSLEIWLNDLHNDHGFHSMEESATSLRVYETGSLMDLYNSLEDTWMSSLSRDIPDRVRVQRERIIRQVALDLYLSSVLIKPNTTKLRDRVQQSGAQHESSELTLPLRTSQLENEFPPSSQTLVLSQTTQPDEAIPSLLNQYTTFKHPKNPAAEQSHIANNILAHLPISPTADPANYSYSTTELDLALATNSLATQNLDLKSRRRAEKLAKAHKKQMEKQAQLKKVTFEQANSLPSIMSSQLPIRAVQSSQAGPVNVTMSSQPSLESAPLVSMTQPERGIFGKRDGKKGKWKAKAGRQKGF